VPRVPAGGTREKRLLRSIALADRPLPVQEAMIVTQALPPQETQLFVVHVWRQRMRFRASVRRVDCAETQLFTTPTRLARYLSEVTAGMPGAAPEQASPTPAADAGGRVSLPHRPAP